MDIKDQVQRVAEVRREYKSRKEAYDASIMAFNAEHREVIDNLKLASTEMTQEEDCLRRLAVTQWQDTKETHPAPGVEIKEITRIVYDRADAFVWAMEHRSCLALDTKKFESAVKAGLVDGIVQETTEPKAYIARDLDKPVE